MPLSWGMNPPVLYPTESQIEDLVAAFYARIRKHPTLGPIFERVIGDDWTPHLKVMCDFWSSVMLTTGRYKGRPIPAHVRINQQQQFKITLRRVDGVDASEHTLRWHQPNRLELVNRRKENGQAIFGLFDPLKPSRIVLPELWMRSRP